MSFIKLDRKILNWGWYGDGNMLKVWIYILCKANIKEGYFQDEVIPRGSFATSIKTIADDCQLSIRNVRTCLDRLQKTGEISLKSTNKFTIINALKYDSYNKRGAFSDKQLTNKRQTNDKQLTTIEEIKKLRNKEINNREDIRHIDDAFLNKWIEAGYSNSQISEAINILGEKINQETFTKAMDILTDETIRNPKGYIYSLMQRGDI